MAERVKRRIIPQAPEFARCPCNGFRYKRIAPLSCNLGAAGAVFRGVRTVFSIVALVVGSVIFAGDPAAFTRFSFCAIPGTTILAGGLFLIGAALWLRD